MKNKNKKKLEKFLILFLIFFSNFVYLSNLLQVDIKADENDNGDEIIYINPIDKLSNELRSNYLALLAKGFEGDYQIDTIVLFKSQDAIDFDIIINDFKSYLNRNHIPFEIKKVYNLIDGIMLYCYVSDLCEIAKNEEVKSIWEDGKCELLLDDGDSPKTANENPLSSTCNYTELIGAIDLWGKGYNGSNIVVSIMDTGIDITGQYEGDLGFLSDDNESIDTKIVGAVSMVPEEPLYYTDLSGRGTYHAGVALGRGKYNESYKGVAPAAKYLNVKIFDSFGITYWSFIISGIEWSLSHGADIILFCYGIPGIYLDPISIAINKVVERGVIVVTPSGDEGGSYMSIDSPGMALKAITVGAYNHSNGEIADFSSRGPSLDFRICPDIIAPGVNLIGSRAKIMSGSFEDFDFLGYTLSDLGFGGFMIPDGMFPQPEYGNSIDGNYTISSGTGAAAAVVAGAIALLIEAFPLATPELLRYALMSTANKISDDVNAIGAGLINVSEAYNFLLDYFTPKQFSAFNIPAPLIYPGVIYSQDLQNLTIDSQRPQDLHAYDSVALLSSQVMMPILMLMNRTDFNFTTIHLLMNQFGLRYNGSRAKWFSEFNVVREMHQVTIEPVGREQYNRYLSVLKIPDIDLYVINIIESWGYSAEYTGGGEVFKNYTNRINAFKLNFHFYNLGDTQIDDLQLVSYFKADLFLNETVGNMTNYMEFTNCSLDDVCKYNESNQMIYIYDENNNTDYNQRYTHNFTSIGFNSTSHQLSSWEIGNSTDLILNLTMNNSTFNLANASTYQQHVEDPGFAMIYNISPQLLPDQRVNFSGILGTGLGTDNYTAYDSMIDQMQRINSNVTAYNNVTDLVVLEVDYNRISNLNERFHSTAKIINLGETLVNSTELIFAINKTNEYGVLEIFSVIYFIKDMKPFEILEYNANWTPTSVGVYMCGWVLGIELLVSIIGPDLGLTSENEDTMLFNNYLMRNIFIIDYNQYKNWNLDSIIITPSKIDTNPFKIYFPGDLGIYNLTIYSLTEIDDVYIKIDDFGHQFCSFILLNFSEDLSSLLTGFMDNPSGNFEDDFTVDMETNYSLNYDRINPYFTVPLFLIAPPITRPGNIAFNISFYSQNEKFYDVLVDFTLADYRGRALFDVVHNNITIYTNGTDLNIEWDERYDHPYGNFFNLRKLWKEMEPKGATIMTLPPGIEYDLTTLDLSSMTDDVSGTDGLLGSVFGAYYLENDFITTNYLNHDIMQLFDVIILDDPESYYQRREIDDLKEWVSRGGVLIMFAEHELENNITAVNDVLSEFGLNASGSNPGPRYIASNNRTNKFGLFNGVGTIRLEDPVNISKINPASNYESLLSDYIGEATYGLGSVLAVGDKDMFGVSGLDRFDNSIFAENIGKWAFSKFYDFNLTTRNITINFGEKIYLRANLTNIDDIGQYLDDDLFFISGFVYIDGTMVNASIMGYEIPVFPMFETQTGNFMVYYDSLWYEGVGNYYFVLLLDHPQLSAEILTFQFTVLSSVPDPPPDDYIYPTPRYPHLFDVIAITLLIGMSLFLWYYNYSKYKRRLLLTPLEGKLLNQARTYISQANSLFQQLGLGIGIKDIKEIDKIRMLLSNKKRVDLLFRDLKNFGDSIGENF